MSMKYLKEHAENAVLALTLAKKEVAHLAYTHNTLFAQKINIEWVRSLSTNEALSEKIDAFVGRFSRLQDHIGDKLIPRFAALLGESPKSLLDTLAFLKARRLATELPIAPKTASEIEALFKSIKVDVSHYIFNKDDANAR